MERHARPGRGGDLEQIAPRPPLRRRQLSSARKRSTPKNLTPSPGVLHLVMPALGAIFMATLQRHCVWLSPLRHAGPPSHSVMPGPMPGIHILLCGATAKKDVDGRDEPRQTAERGHALPAWGHVRLRPFRHARLLPYFVTPGSLHGVTFGPSLSTSSCPALGPGMTEDPVMTEERTVAGLGRHRIGLPEMTRRAFDP